MRKLIVTALVNIFVLSAGAAIAAPAGTVTVKLIDIRRGDIVESGISFQAEGESAAGIRRLEIAIDNQVVASVEPSNLKTRVTVPYDWATTYKRGSTELSYNGEYTIKARAVAIGGADEITTATVIVDNPAATPTGLTATPQGEQVALSWNPNSEPDLLGYQVERLSSGSYIVVGETTETSFVDTVDPGDHSYRVIAVRNSAARSSGRPSLPSEAVNVNIAAPRTDTKGKPHFGVGPAPAGATKGAKRFEVKGTTFAPRGLPSGAALPGSVGLPSLPSSAAPEQRWGTYEERLPYELPEGGVPLSASQRDLGETWTLLPSDGLRWVALGALLLSFATLLRLLARRLEAMAGPAELKL